MRLVEGVSYLAAPYHIIVNNHVPPVVTSRGISGTVMWYYYSSGLTYWKQICAQWQVAGRISCAENSTLQGHSSMSHSRTMPWYCSLLILCTLSQQSLPMKRKLHSYLLQLLRVRYSCLLFQGILLYISSHAEYTVLESTSCPSCRLCTLALQEGLTCT